MPKLVALSLILVLSGVLASADDAARVRPEAKRWHSPFPRRVKALHVAPSAKPSATQRAVNEALRWLAAHQSPDGRWEAEGFGRWCDGAPQKQASALKEGRGRRMYDVGITGLVLQAFLAAGVTPDTRSQHAPAVSRALKWLISQQDRDGCVGSRKGPLWIYNHALASLAFVESFAVTGDRRVGRAAQRSLDYSASLRKTGLVWGDGDDPRSDRNDTSISAWMTLAAHVAQMVNDANEAAATKPPLRVDGRVFGGMARWLEKVTEQDYGRVGYAVRGSGPARPHRLAKAFPARYSESLTSIGLLMRHLAGDGEKHKLLLDLSLVAMFDQLPQWKSGGHIDMYYWHWGSLATWQVGAEAWSRWRTALHAAVLPNQRSDGTYCRFRGSWDPRDPWAAEGGRIYATAICCLSLLSPTRFERVRPN